MRLVDTEVLRQIAKNTTPAQTRLLLNEKIEKIKQTGAATIRPTLLNGLAMVVVCLIIYAVLHYRYYKKCEKNNNITSK
jgi:hypothetical protein